MALELVQTTNNDELTRCDLEQELQYYDSIVNGWKLELAKPVHLRLGRISDKEVLAYRDQAKKLKTIVSIALMHCYNNSIETYDVIDITC